MSDLINETMKSVPPLGRGTPNFAGTHIGGTINLPRVKAFTKLDSAGQKELLKGLLKFAMANTKRSKGVFTLRYYFERCKDGHQHIHFIMSNLSLCPILGVDYMIDLDKSICRHSNIFLKISPAWKNGYNHKFTRIRKPMLCLQLLRDQPEYDRWDLYIQKDQPKKN